jgi:hypothetical protein
LVSFPNTFYNSQAANAGSRYSASNQLPGQPMLGPTIQGSPLATESGPPQDRFLEAKYSISSQQVLGFFLAGFVVAFGGRSMGQFLNKKKISPEAAFNPNILGKDRADDSKLTVYQNYNNALSSIYRLIQLDPKQGNALLVYVSTCILGYLSGSLMQGTKETWVRQQETKIRAHLINRLQDVVRQSIHNKYAFNSRYKESIRLRVVNLLTQNQVTNLNYYIQETPVLEPLDMNRRFFYEPTHRTLKFGLALNGQNNEWLNNTASSPKGEEQKDAYLLLMAKGFITGLGVFSGFVVQGFIKLMQTPKGAKDMTAGQKSVWESIQLKDAETWSLIGTKSRRNFVIMAGFFSMSAAASVGKTLLDGLREIEVTRLNARTEYGYQTHNWLSQDPMFHYIAEEEAAENELRQIQIDLPCLKYNPPLLRQRIQALLSNIGRNSAPPYYPMTPTVGLVEARA